MRFRLCMLMALAVALMGCVDSDCTMENAVRLRCQTCTSSEGTTTSVRLQDTLTVRTLRPDTVLLNRAIALDAFTLPMSYARNADTLLLCLACRNGAHTTDTLLIAHTNVPHFESLDCATSVFHEITAVDFRHDTQATNATTRIDSVKTENVKVNYDKTNHLNVYISMR